MKTNVQTVIIWLFLLFVTGSSLNLYFKANSRVNRMEENLKAVNEKVEYFKTRDQHNAARITAQELTISELRRIHPAIISEFKNLYIPPRLAQSYTKTSQTLQAEIKAPIKDSIPAVTGINTVAREPEKIKVLKYRDKWISIFGELYPDTAKIKVLAKDTIFTAIHRGERRRPWLWVLSKRKLQTSATNRSPYISINVIQSGVIKQ